MRISLKNTQQDKSEDMFTITCVCKDDIRTLYEDDPDREFYFEMINRMDESDMSWLAGKIADAMLNCCYWDTLKDRSEQIMQEKMAEWATK